jgi:hypothetical protein
MNLFINIFNNWTVYEWILIGSSLTLTFLLTNLATYLFTKNWQFNKSISLTLIISAITYTLLTFIAQFLPIEITSLFLIPILLIAALVITNWVTLISYYHKFRNSKSFSLIPLKKEHKRDSVRSIIFLTIAMLSVCIFLREELLAIFVITYLSSTISIYIDSILVQKFIHD